MSKATVNGEEVTAKEVEQIQEMVKQNDTE